MEFYTLRRTTASALVLHPRLTLLTISWIRHCVDVYVVNGSLVSLKVNIPHIAQWVN